MSSASVVVGERKRDKIRGKLRTQEPVRQDSEIEREREGRGDGKWDRAAMPNPPNQK